MKNAITNYFVVPPVDRTKTPQVFYSPVTIGADTAKQLLQEKLKLEGKKLPPGQLLHVCFDVDSEQIYSPNASSFDPKLRDYLLQSAQLRITKDFGSFSTRPVIEGSPYNLIRLRSVSSFGYANNIIKKHYGDKMFKDIPVIEANLEVMPDVISSLPPAFKNEAFKGGYVGNGVASVSFVFGEGQKKRVLLQQRTPFILINAGRKAAKDATEKESVVIMGYRDYLYDNEQEDPSIQKNIASFADLYAIKRYLYLGWPLEDISHILMQSVANLQELINAIELIMTSAKSLQDEGYPTPTKQPYYTSLKVDPVTFPMDNRAIEEFKGGFNRYFKIIDYNPKLSPYMLIESPVFIPAAVCRNVFRCRGNPFISHYNDVLKKIDVKSGPESLREMQPEKVQMGKIKALIEYDRDGGTQAMGF